MGKSLSNKYGQKFINSAQKSTPDAIKTASKRAIQKTAEAAGDLIGEKPNNNKNNNNMMMKMQKQLLLRKHISPEERKQIIDELRLLPKKYV